MKYINLVIGILFTITISLFSYKYSEASFVAGPANSEIEVVCAQFCGSDLNKLQLEAFRGVVFISVYSRPFNFILSSGGNLVSGGKVPIDTNLTYSNVTDKSAEGSWLVSGGNYDTPPMNGLLYLVGNLGPKDNGPRGISIKPPVNSNPSSIVGTGAVTCNGSVCKANKEGNASITVTFPAGSVQATSLPKYPEQDPSCSINGNRFNCGQDLENIAYGEQKIIITFSVYQPNRIPVVTNCKLTNTGYNTANINWDYLDEDKDPQTRFKISNFINSNEGKRDRADILVPSSVKQYSIDGLVAGARYNDIKIQVHDGKEWSSPFKCNTITTDQYPDPNLTFTLSGDGRTVNYNDLDKTLVLKTGKSVNTRWSINNGTEIGLASCTLSTSGGGNLTGEQTFRDKISGTGFSRNINNILVPTIPDDRTYLVRLNCIGKKGYPTRTVDETINLKVESYPTVSCSINGRNTVQAGQTDVNIQATVGNVSSYRFTIGRKAGDSQTLSGNEFTPNLNRTLSYTGIEFGRHNPWIEVTKLPIINSEKKVRVNCGTVTNLGDSNISEVR